MQRAIARLLGTLVEAKDIKGHSRRPLTEACAVGDKAQSLKTSYIQFLTNNNTSKPVGKVTLDQVLSPFAYRIEDSMEGPVFTKFAPQTDELLLFESSPMKSILEEIDRFWGLGENYAKLGFLHNRGILVHGAPGSGKSSLFQQVTEMMINRGDVVFFATNVSALKEGLRVYREVEPNRKVVVVFEDIDEIVGYSERAMLQLLDGDAQIQRVLYLGSTNYLDRIPPRLIRPGRFDKVVHIGPPKLEARHVYLKKKLEGKEKPEKIQWLAEQTDGFSFGHLRELIIGGYALCEPLDKVIQRLRTGKA